MRFIENYIIDKILEPLKYAVKLFGIWGKVAHFCEKIGLGPMPTAIISSFIAGIAICAIIVAPGLIIAWIINKIREL